MFQTKRLNATMSFSQRDQSGCVFVYMNPRFSLLQSIFLFFFDAPWLEMLQFGFVFLSCCVYTNERGLLLLSLTPYNAFYCFEFGISEFVYCTWCVFSNGEFNYQEFWNKCHSVSKCDPVSWVNVFFSTV